MNALPSVLAGRYHVGDQLYSDGTVTIYRGYDQLLNRAVGIELLDASQSPDLETTLQDKARRMALAELPHVAALYDQGEQGGHSFLIIEELAQHSLAESVPLTPTATADLIAALATTLRAAAQKHVPAPRIDADTVRVSNDGLFQIVNWGTAAPQRINDVALLTPILALAVTGEAQTPDQIKRARRGAKLSPMERILERAANGRYGTLDELVADVEAAKSAATDPTVVVGRGKPTVMVPVEPDQQPMYAPAPRRFPWLPVVLIVLALLAGGVVYGTGLFDRSDDTAAQEPTTAATTATPNEGSAPTPTTEPQGQPFVVATNGGVRLNVRSDPNPDATIIGKLNNGDTVSMLEGPVEGGGYSWARVQFGDTQGWCVYGALRAQ